MEINYINFMSSRIDGTSLSMRIPDFIRSLRWLGEKLIRLLNPGDDRMLQSRIAYLSLSIVTGGENLIRFLNPHDDAMLLSRVAYLCEQEYRSLSRDCC
ncbi:hypothetical protein L1987_35682 [Smallanthus sonchifolius]|uniref:Uncharacterized protein n=1 Tax=Smallanthus sonchifolius TaxID=185202 RepID=A0ACB9HBH8_9ASTR|nr:hypothetical protein L1987_35682 [Smallanthus sonchifolius]